jgi:hypothetical protein
MGRGLLWEVRARATRTSAPILRCGARGGVRLGERGSASVVTFYYWWSRRWKAVLVAAATSEGDEARHYWWMEDQNRAWLWNVVSSSYRYSVVEWIVWVSCG